MQDKIISIVRIGVSAIVSFLFTWLVTKNILGEEFSDQINSLIETLSVAIGMVIYYAISRLAEEYFPWFLVFKNPNPPKNNS
jgi:hypothetical protein